MMAQDVTDAEAQALLDGASLRDVAQTIVRLRRTYGLRMEIERAETVATSADPRETIEQFTFYRNYLMLARTECEGARLEPGRHVVFLGSGPLPLSLIMLCSSYGLRGTGIERVKAYADLSRTIVERLGLAQRIEIHKGDHLTFPWADDHDHIMVGAVAEPRDEIFRHLAACLAPGASVSYRLYEKGLRRLFDTASSYVPPDEFTERLRIRPTPPVHNTVVFLERR